MSMHFVSSLSNAKVCFHFPSNAVIWDWSSPSSAATPHALALDIGKKRRRMLDTTWWSLSLTFLILIISKTENCRKWTRELSFPVSRRAFLVQLDHIKGKTKMQAFWLFGDPQACSYLLLLFKKYVHLITCAPFQNILFSWQIGHVLAVMQCTGRSIGLCPFF